MALPMEFEADYDVGEPPTVLHVFLLGARDLPAVDRNRFSKASSEDAARINVGALGLLSRGCQRCQMSLMLSFTWCENPQCP